MIDGSMSYVLEVGPRLSFTTAWSANAVSICKACGLDEVTRIERSRRYKLFVNADEVPLDSSQLEQFAALVRL
jgi:phosphoribosylformylglycinamidine synthase